MHGHSHARPVPLDLPAEDEEDDDEEKLSPMLSQSHNISVLVDDTVESPKTPTDYSETYSNHNSSPAGNQLLHRNDKSANKKQSGMCCLFFVI